MASEHSIPSPDNRKPTPPLSTRRVINRVVRRVEHTAFWLAVVLSALYFLLQMPAVQNSLVDSVCRFFAKEWHTEVAIRHVDVQFFDNLLLEGVFLADTNGDTLLYIERLNAGLNSNIFSLLRNKLEFNELALYGARFHLRRAEGQSDYNLRFLIDYFSGEKQKEKSNSPFLLRIRNLRLRDIAFEQNDRLRGQRLYAYLNSGVLRLERLAVPQNRIHLQSVLLDGFRFDVQGFPVPTQTGASAQPVRMLEPIDSMQATEAADTLWFQVDRFALNNGQFHLDQFHLSAARTMPDSVMDFQHMHVRDIVFKADSVLFNDQLQFVGALKHLAAKEASGFEIRHAAAKRVVVNDTITGLYGMQLETTGSILGDTIVLTYDSYRDYNTFVDDVGLDVRLKKGSRLLLGDVTSFSAPLARNLFFQNNFKKEANLEGWVNGPINRLNGRNMLLEVGNSTYFEGAFDLDDIAEGPDRMRLQFECKQLQSNMKTLRSIIPGFNAPAQFDEVGNFSFSGSYQLLFGYNHIVSGNLDSDVGYGKVDMELDLTEGRDRATYSGQLNLKDFDVAAWTGNKAFGRSAFQVNIAEGSSGLRLASLKTTVTGKVDTLYFKGYPYQNIEMDARFDAYDFTGNVAVNDPNFNIVIEGRADLSDSIKYCEINGQVNNINLLATHLMDKPWTVSGRIPKLQLTGSSLDNMSGKVLIEDINMLQDTLYVHHMDSISFESRYLLDGSRRYILLSDAVDGYLNGVFNLSTLPVHVASLYATYFPNLCRKLGFERTDTLALTDRFDFNIRVKDTRDLTRLIDIQLDTLKEVSLIGRVDARTGFTEVKLDAPMVHYANVRMRFLDFKWHSLKDVADFDFLLPETQFGKKRSLSAIRLFGNSQNDELNFSIQAQDSADSTMFVRGIDLNGTLSVADSLWQIQFNTSKIELFNELWVMDEQNYLRFGPNVFDAREFEFMNGNRRITFDSFNDHKGMQVTTTNLNLNYLNRFIVDSSLYISANIYDLDCRIDDLYALKGLHFSINTDTVYVNGQSYGILQGDIDQVASDEPVLGKIFLRQAESFLRVNAAYLPETAAEAYTDPELKKVAPGQFQSNVGAVHFPLQVLETFVPGISKTDGAFLLNATVGGKPEKPDINGKVLIEKGQFEIDYLKTMFHLTNQAILLNNNQIWAEGDTIRDASTQHGAIVYGGLRHDRFTNWEIQCSVESLNDRFMVMNTQKKDNDLFYGQVMGRFRANFSGSFQRTNISINAITGAGTKLYIPLSTASEVKQASFIRFEKGDEVAVDNTKPRRKPGGATGLNFNLNVTVTDDAEVQLIFDEQTGDIIKGKGSGDLTISINREGEFNMYGGYTIKTGEYLFTLLNIVNKPFKVAEGGTINWYGDPYGAQIRLDANYATSTPIYNLLSTELEVSQNEDLIREARKTTQVLVTLHLTGDLFKPTITFDMAFPNLDTRLRTLADSKLRLMKQDQNELMRQVFGLLVVGTFLPANSSLGQSSDYVTTAFNTVSQVLTNQLSNYLTGLASEWFGSTISSIDLDIMYTEYRNDVLSAGSVNTEVGREFQVRLSSGFVDDRILVNVGSQFGSSRTPGTSIQEGFLGEDVSVEIVLTENKQWRIKVYQRTEPDITGGQWRNRIGFGISFRKEYDSFFDMIDGFTKWMKN